ncbi:MAG: DUF6370 family protein [Gemmataceae bacterium]|nr:DUF6370 family protein [Gemmataceae bacterium]
MRLMLSLVIAGLALLLTAGVDAGGDKKAKEVKLKGTITCAKCDLGVAKACATVIVTKREKKDVTIYFDAASDKKYHAEICTEAKKGSLVGTIKKEGKKEIISVKELKFD